MNTVFAHIASLFRNTTGRLAIAAALAGTGAVSTAQAHPRDAVEVNVELRGREFEHRHFVEGRFEERQTRVWVEPVYNTVPGAKTFIEPVYRTVVDRVWREPVVREDAVQVLVPAVWEERDGIHRHHGHRERFFIAAHYETRPQTVVVVPGHFEDVARQELVSEGRYECGPDQQVLLTPGHFEVRTERVCLVPGHWEERAVIRVR